eukprot:4594082-Pyramimonas_sp.AAC.1
MKALGACIAEKTAHVNSCDRLGKAAPQPRATNAGKSCCARGGVVVDPAERVELQKIDAVVAGRDEPSL